MSLLDLASLVLAPTATKEGKVYSAIPDTGDGDMTFSRGSAATRVNSAGLIEKERGNLLLQSNSFDTTWATTNASVTGGQTGYDGSSDAWLFTSTGNFARIQQSAGPTGVLTLSAYVKAGTTDWVMLRLAGAGYNVTQYFDLTNGVVGSISGISAKITSVGGGWYRCEATANALASASSYIYSALGDGNLSVTNETIYIQDAMLNEGLVAQSYIETTTSAVYEGITDDVPRVDYSGGGCPSLLLEGQRSNLIASSEYFDSSVGWESVGSFTANATISPEGLINASSLNTDYLEVRPSVVSGTDYTYSIFVKANTDTTPQIIFTGTSFPNTQANYDLNTGSVTSYTTQSAGIDDYGNGWYRIYATETATATDSTSRLRFYCQTSYIYGAMFEAGSYVSSYIPTYGTSTTRVADSCSKTGISELIGQTEGTALLDFQFNGEGESIIMDIAASGLSPQNRIILYQPNTTIVQFIILFNSSEQVNIASSGYSVGQRLKVGITYKANDFAFYINGTQIGTDTSGSVPSASRIDIGNRQDLGYPATISVNQFYLSKTRLTNDELAELTKL